MDGAVPVELHLPDHTVRVSTLPVVPQFGDEVDVSGVIFVVEGVRAETLPPIVTLTGQIGPPVWGRRTRSGRGPLPVA